MRNRLLFGSLLVAAVTALLYADARLAGAAAPAAFRQLGLAGMDGAIVGIVIAVLSLIGLRELGSLVAAAGSSIPLAWLSIACVTLALIPVWAANSDAPAAVHGPADARLSLAAVALGFIGGAIAVLCRRRTEGGIGALSATALALIYLGVLPGFIVRLRISGGDAGVGLLIYFLATVKLCDIGAYFTGYFLGRHKLIEWLSPKKTIEGLAGGVAASVAFAVGASLAARQFAGDGSGSAVAALAAALPGPGRAAIFGVSMALVGQLGDLVESLIKRDAGAKDSAKAIPAFGGVLDVLDSPLFTAPLACWLLLE